MVICIFNTASDIFMLICIFKRMLFFYSFYNFTRLSSFLNSAAPNGCSVRNSDRRRAFCSARLKIGDLRPLVLKQLDCRNAWQSKKPYLLWFSMFLTEQPLGALNRVFHKNLIIEFQWVYVFYSGFTLFFKVFWKWHVHCRLPLIYKRAEQFEIFYNLCFLRIQKKWRRELTHSVLR